MTQKQMALQNETFAFLDIETTGGNPQRDRITEIGVRFWRAGELIGEWQTLLNPEARISGFIERLTGISNAMVADAPLFADIASELEQQLDGAIFVAHNARFDYGFIKAEFRRLEQAFSARVLCTVRLSRALYPDEARHNMDALIARHHLPQVERHRAMGDVAAMLAFFEHARREHGDDVLNQAIHRLLQRQSTPSNVPAEIFAELPQAPGVYRFYGDNDVLLYVGKSTNIAQRVASHFSGDHQSSRGLRMSESLRRVEFTQTAGELGALLLELKQIKSLSPLYNRRSRAAKSLSSIALRTNSDGYLQAELVRSITPDRLGDYFGLFRSKRDAQTAIRGIAAKNDLCGKLLGLEPASPGPCFQRSLGRCKGACDGAEDTTRYNLRMQIAFHALRLKTWPWPGSIGLVEENPDTSRTDILVICNWIHIATVHSEQELENFEPGQEPVTFDLDSYKLLVKALLGRDRKQHRIIELPPLTQPAVLMP
ncbi:MAG: DNA polymerase III subunit epsilon [Marinobacter excellens HL-55]|uniref:Excinuclease cho n=1 Tax=Marinobacter excellens HL-55 TaxID=1305731 RepID=A0A0P7YDS0_9GAMM|nr:MAG: DNA polymerase III subunit epsilon [Marinobacter excellens HL-55]